MQGLPDQTPIVARVRERYPTPLGVEHAECLLAIAKAIGHRAGLLRKDGGTNIVLPDGTRVAQDIICFENGDHFDCLGDGEGAAIPGWDYKGKVDPARYYDVGSAPDPEPEPDPELPPSNDQVVDLLRGIHGELKLLRKHLGA